MNTRAINAADLLTSLSQGKTILLLQALDPNLLDQMEYSLDFIHHCKLKLDTAPNVFDDFLTSGLLLIEEDLSRANMDFIFSLVEFLKSPRFKNVISSYLYIDGNRVTAEEDLKFVSHEANTPLLH
ncbi:hypothetical protein [Dendrosporobacter sp. 1207_IL3150]|uniref:hypothetical protein n=1 Tax=Dendrosporobacter sp. 1207_IL3150 TaxID=3084054 RepID=UPI002FDAEDEF